MCVCEGWVAHIWLSNAACAPPSHAYNLRLLRTQVEIINADAGMWLGGNEFVTVADARFGVTAPRCACLAHISAACAHVAPSCTCAHPCCYAGACRRGIPGGETEGLDGRVAISLAHGSCEAAPNARAHHGTLE